MKNEIVQAQRLLAANPPKSEEAFKILKGLESTNNKEVYGLLAEVYILLEDLEQALVYAKSALSLDEEFVPAWMSLGAVSRKKGEVNRALKFYSKANQFDTGNAEIAAAIADIYFLVGNTSGAESLYKTARNLDSNSINAAFGLAKVLNYYGAFDEAVIRLNEILEKDGEHQEAKELLEKSVRGEKISISLFNQKNEKTEINDNETNEVDAWKLYLSKLPWPSKLFEEGVDVFEQSNANYLHALRYLSKIELQSPGVSGKQELLSESLELLLDCFEKNEPSTPLYFLLSRALILAEKKEEAKFILQTLLKVPSFDRIDLPFLPPLSSQDHTEVIQDPGNWILVRMIEAYLSLLSEEEIEDPANKKLAAHLLDNPDAFVRFGGRVTPKPPRIFPYDFWDAYPTLEKAQKITAFTRRISNQEFHERVLLQIIEETAQRLDEAPTDNVAFFVQVHALLGLNPENGAIPGTSKELDAVLIQRDWWGKRGLYNYWFEKIENLKTPSGSEVTAVVIANKFKQKSVENLKRLSGQLDGIGEILFVNNGQEDQEFKQLLPYVDTYVKANGNAGAYLARNLGALFAKGKYLVFVDDDGIPDESFINAHLKEHKQRGNIVVSRGVYYSDDVTEDPWHYNIGNKVKPAITILEGNAFYNADAFYRAGGWGDYILFGYGGTELSYRLLEFYPDKKRQIFVPGSRLNHQYFRGDGHKSGKKIKQKVSKMLLDCLHPDLEKEVRDWPSSFDGEESIYINYSWEESITTK